MRAEGPIHSVDAPLPPVLRHRISVAMSLSVLDLFTIGIGPSSSHTVGPMRAGARFVQRLKEAGLLDKTTRVVAHLYGSLALTGKGHGTDKAVLLGLEGETPEQVNVDAIAARLQKIREEKSLKLGGTYPVSFDESKDLLFHRMENLPAHPNGLRFTAHDAGGQELLTKTYYSVGGGFVVSEVAAAGAEWAPAGRPLPFPYRSGADLLRLCAEQNCSISELTLRNEATFRPEAETRAALLRVWTAM